MQINFSDKVFQITNGFLIERSGFTYLTDNDFNLIEAFRFRDILDTTMNLVVNSHRQILNIETGEIRNYPFDLDVIKRQYIVSDDEFLDWDKNQFHALLKVYTVNDKVVFSYDKPYQTDILGTFKSYFYVEGKSILIYKNFIEVYAGELFSLQRFDDALHSKKKAYKDKNYAILIGIFDVKMPILNRLIPKYVIFPDNVLDLASGEMYNAKNVIGIVNRMVITKEENYNLSENKKENHVNEWNDITI